MAFSEPVGGGVDQRRKTARRSSRSTHRGGGGRRRSPEVGSPAYRPLLQSALGDLNSPRLSTRRSLSLLPSKSKHPRRLLLPAALLMLLPCLELTIVAHQPLAKAYSMVVQYSPHPCSILPTPAEEGPLCLSSLASFTRRQRTTTTATLEIVELSF